MLDLNSYAASENPNLNSTLIKDIVDKLNFQSVSFSSAQEFAANQDTTSFSEVPEPKNNLRRVHSRQTDTKHEGRTDINGEYVLKGTPSVHIGSNKLVYPQHYLRFKHTLATVESIVFDLEYDDKYQLFIYESNGSIFLQVGIVGVENFDSSMNKPTKIVYGRCWKIEPELPTSELIQTAFLALQKAKEHEVREIFRVHQINEDKKRHKTTPFNNHLDLPLFASHAEEMLSSTYRDNQSAEVITEQSVRSTLNSIQYGKLHFELESIQNISDNQSIVILTSCGTDPFDLPELPNGTKLPIVLEQNCINHFMHALVNQLINKSNRHVEENFKYRNYARFSWDNDVKQISSMSLTTRNLHKKSQHQSFISRWDDVKYQTDSTRVPKIIEGKLADRIEQKLSRHTPLEGCLPDIFSHLANVYAPNNF